VLDTNQYQRSAYFLLIATGSVHRVSGASLLLLCMMRRILWCLVNDYYNVYSAFESTVSRESGHSLGITRAVGWFLSYLDIFLFFLPRNIFH
jgi:hypothetical protein